MASDHGWEIGPGDPQRHLACATTYAQHVLYGRPSSAQNNYSTSLGAIRAQMRRINAVLNESSLDSGGPPADYRVLCDEAGEIAVGQFTSPANDYDSVSSAARAAGYDRSDIKYTIFYDGNNPGICGQANVSPDERLIQSNFNNSGGDYAVTYRNCWENRTAMHENGHNMGAVQQNAPHSTGTGWHCNDTLDVMCYAPDGGNKNQSEVLLCADKMHFDCNHDTYFDSATEPGEYLASNWNIGSGLNRFLAWDGTPPPVENQPPVADFEWSCLYGNCAFSSISTDEWVDALDYHWDFDDGTTNDWSGSWHNYSAAGDYQVSLTVTDYLGLSDTEIKTVSISFDDPDPAVPNLTDGQWTYSTVGATGTWKFFKLGAYPGNTKLTFDLYSGCGFQNAVCNPVVDLLCPAPVCASQLDLYVLRGARPAQSSYTCRSAGDTNAESCSVNYPPGGWWYLGVYARKGVAGQQFRVRAMTPPFV